jgi:hypothetical protein
MKKSLPLVFSVALLAAFAAPGSARQQAERNAQPTPVAEPQLPGGETADAGVSPNPMVGALSGKVKAVDPAAKTFTVKALGRIITFSAANLGNLPTVGEKIFIEFAENPGGPPMATSMMDSTAAAAARFITGSRHCGNKDVPGGYHDPLYTLNVCKDGKSHS